MLDYQLALRDANLASIKTDCAVTIIHRHNYQCNEMMKQHFTRHPPLAQKDQELARDALEQTMLRRNDILRDEHQRLANIARAQRHRANIARAAYDRSRSVTGHEDMWNHFNA
jgi:hypothetical protein